MTEEKRGAVIYLRYLRYVIRHKWFVFLECARVGLFWEGITHDLSKLLWDEFLPYARNFYGNDRQGFDRAWLLHLKRNRHHWQWWCVPGRNGDQVVIEMPLKYRMEMLADWTGAGKAQGNKDVASWYRNNKDTMRLGPATKYWVEAAIRWGRLDWRE